MNKKEEKLHIKRIDRFIERVTKNILSNAIPLKAEFALYDERVVFGDKESLAYKVIAQGESWGTKWQHAWFKLSGMMPKNSDNQHWVLRIDLGGEGLVYNTKGIAMQGISNGSIFDYDFNRDIVELTEQTKPGNSFELWVDAASSALFGVHTVKDPAEDAHNRYGEYDAKLNAAELVQFDDDYWHLWLDLRIMRGFIKTLPEHSVRRARIIRSVNEAIDLYADRTGDASRCREVLRHELDKHADASALSVTAVGHAHIDTAWLWPILETEHKCSRTFASQLDLIERYPDYIFGASQPQHYEFVRENDPELFERIKQAVKKGQWELQGGMWVEADCNLINGESMIRQILHGKNYFRDHFGIEVDNLWLPDVFGYSAAMPQIMLKSGLKYFLTQKMSWSQFNKFPHHTFLWRGIDGSEVLTHFPPENNYNSQLGTDSLVPAQDHFIERDFIDSFISLFGVGDGGGGPKAENIELGKRTANLEGSPRLSFGTASSFFESLEQYRNKLAVWSGELYLELHRGTLTTQAAAKQGNRLLEQILKSLEMVACCAPLDNYPSEQLDCIWRNVLKNQFHDILPGSSITKVYDTLDAEYSSAIHLCGSLMEATAESIFTEDENAVTILNSTHYPFDGAIELPEEWGNNSALDSNGNALIVQTDNDRSLARVKIEPYSFTTIHKSDDAVQSVESDNKLILDNDLVLYQFNEHGQIVEAYDKTEQRKIILSGECGNILSLFVDRPNDWDAWDIDIFYENQLIETASSVGSAVRTFGLVGQALNFELKIGESTISQEIRLENNSKRLDFDTAVGWCEKHRMLRVSFATTIRSEYATYDIQYGHVQRPTHRNTQWDRARFEVVGQRYADLSDKEFGVALINDCKYGYKIHENVIDLNLLRSPSNPDPDADQGHHRFIYSLLPHSGQLIDSNVMAEAAIVNNGICMIDGFKTEMLTMPWSVSGRGLSLEAVKKAEKENTIILRIVETDGRHSHGILKLTNKYSRIVETDLMEWHDKEIGQSGNEIELKLKPFEIKTLKIHS